MLKAAYSPKLIDHNEDQMRLMAQSVAAVARRALRARRADAFSRLWSAARVIADGTPPVAQSVSDEWAGDDEEVRRIAELLNRFADRALELDCDPWALRCLEAVMELEAPADRIGRSGDWYSLDIAERENRLAVERAHGLMACALEAEDRGAFAWAARLRDAAQALVRDLPAFHETGGTDRYLADGHDDE